MDGFCMLRGIMRVWGCGGMTVTGGGTPGVAATAAARLAPAATATIRPRARASCCMPYPGGTAEATRGHAGM